MLISIHQPYYIPWLGLFHKILVTDKIVLLDHVQYADKDMQNRNYIKTHQGRLLLSVPVILPHYDTPANQIKIDNSKNWRKKHCRSIEMSYRKAKYFDQYIDYFNKLYQKEWEYLVDLNIEVIKFIATELKLNLEFIRSSELDIKAQKNEQLVEICKKVKADAFLSGSFAAKAYLDHDIFPENNIKLYVHDFKHPEYPQLNGEFTPCLSAVDLLFNCGSEGRCYLEKGGSRPDA